MQNGWAVGIQVTRRDLPVLEEMQCLRCPVTQDGPKAQCGGLFRSLVERECNSAYKTCSMHMQGPYACVRSGSIKDEVTSPARLQQKVSYYDKDSILLMSWTKGVSMILQNWRVSCMCGNTWQNYIQSDEEIVEAMKNLILSPVTC